AESLSSLHKYDESLDILSLSEHIYLKLPKSKSNEITKRKANSLQIESLNYQGKSDFRQALILQRRCLSLYNKIEDKYGAAGALQNMGITYWFKGELNQASDYYQQSISLFKELGNKRRIASCLNNIAVVCGSKGEINQALEYFLQVLKLREEVGATESLGTADTLNNIGILYLQKGELDLSLEYYQKSLSMKKNLGASNQKIAQTLNNIGIIYMHKGKSDQAFDYLNQSLSLFKEVEDRFLMAHSLLDLIIVTLDKSSLKMALEYLDLLEEINSHEENKVISQLYRVAKAIILKTSIRSRQRVEAEEILKQVVTQEIVNHEVSIWAMLHLCELLLFELRITNDLDVLRELKSLNSRISDIAKRQGSHWLLAEVYVFKSKLMLVELDLQGAQQYLDSALVIAEEKGMKRLATKILNEKDTFQQQMSNWQYFVRKGTPVNERLDLAQLEGLVMEMARKRLDVTDEDVLNYAQIAQNLKQQWADT
ncbi:MAG: tetratricopeptide repeat protein, partial [Candidatus Heimdallarchaeota archaeon]